MSDNATRSHTATWNWMRGARCCTTDNPCGRHGRATLACPRGCRAPFECLEKFTGRVYENCQLRQPHATPDRAAEHYLGEPTPVEMLRDLQRALFGASYASHRSPADEWAHLIDCVKAAVPRAPWDKR